MEPLNFSYAPLDRPYISKIDLVTNGLKKAILTGEIKSGQKLSSEEICRVFGVSRAPVREALRRLESDGLVKIYPQQYVQVTHVDTSSLLELSQLRICLEELAFRLALPHLTPEVFQALRANVKAESEEKDQVRLFNISLEFHFILVRLSGNRELLSVYTKIMEKFQRFLRLEYYDDAYVADKRYHARIIDLLEKGLYDDALDLLREDVDMCEKNVRDQLAKAGEVQD